MRKALSLLASYDVVIASLLYWVSHVVGLLALPVFADEAIYIRWAQLIQDDASRYAFFSMADGKPPLFIWLLSLVGVAGVDPVLTGRLLAVGIGFLQLLAMRWFIITVGGGKVAQRFGMLAVGILPFWFFLHRMALMDGLLVLCLTGAVTAAFRISQAVQRGKQPLWPVVMFILSYGGALWTKTPALFVIPIIGFIPGVVWLSLPKRPSIRLLARSLGWVVLAGGLAGLVFATLRISPLFGALFSRSSDFSFSFPEILAGEWRYILFTSLPRNLSWMIAYLTLASAVLAFVGLKDHPKRWYCIWALLAAAWFFVLLTGIGRVLWPRYFLPSALFLTLAVSLGFEFLYRQARYRVFAMILGSLLVVRSVLFIVPLVHSVEETPFVAADATQYLQEWSAGYGNAKVRDFIIRRQQQLQPGQQIIVLTEGSFGTLPDGLLMYFRTPEQIASLQIHGVGVAIAQIPAEYVKAAETNEVYYVANEHRLGLASRNQVQEIARFVRPFSAPALILFRVLP